MCSIGCMAKSGIQFLLSPRSICSSNADGKTWLICLFGIPYSCMKVNLIEKVDDPQRKIVQKSQGFCRCVWGLQPSYTVAEKKMRKHATSLDILFTSHLCSLPPRASLNITRGLDIASAQHRNALSVLSGNPYGCSCTTTTCWSPTRQ